MTGAVRPLIFSHDNGSYSNKIWSTENNGSFLSMAAPATEISVNSFGAGLTSLTDSYDLEIFSPKFENGDSKRIIGFEKPERFIIGEDAEKMNGMERTPRDMDRFNNHLYKAFVCAALRVAFPNRCQPISDIKDNRGQINLKWATPVYMVGMTAPSYFSKIDMLEQAALGTYAFIDKSTDKLYIFRVEDFTGVPESFGGYAMRLWDLNEDNKISDNKQKNALEHMTIAIWDFGGRTTDYMIIRKRKTVKYGSLDVGLHQYIDEAIEIIMANRLLVKEFAQKPTRSEIIEGMKLRDKAKAIKIPGRDGKKVDVTEIIDAQMKNLSHLAENAYKNELNSGQGIDMLFYMGGVSSMVDSYLKDSIRHERKAFISKDKRMQYMGNAYGAFLYGLYLEGKTHANETTHILS